MTEREIEIKIQKKKTIIEIQGKENEVKIPNVRYVEHGQRLPRVRKVVGSNPLLL